MTRPRKNDSGDLGRIRQEAEKLQARSSRSTSPSGRGQSPADRRATSDVARRSADARAAAPVERERRSRAPARRREDFPTYRRAEAPRASHGGNVLGWILVAIAVVVLIAVIIAAVYFLRTLFTGIVASLGI